MMIHYLFDSENNVDSLMNNIKNNTDSTSYVMVFYMDGELLSKHLIE